MYLLVWSLLALFPTQAPASCQVLGLGKRTIKYSDAACTTVKEDMEGVMLSGVDECAGKTEGHKFTCESKGTYYEQSECRPVHFLADVLFYSKTKQCTGNPDTWKYGFSLMCEKVVHPDGKSTKFNHQAATIEWYVSSDCSGAPVHTRTHQAGAPLTCEPGLGTGPCSSEAGSDFSIKIKYQSECVVARDCQSGSGLSSSSIFNSPKCMMMMFFFLLQA